MNEPVFRAVVSALADGEPAALVTIISTEGSTPQRVGAKLLVYEDGRSIGTIGGGCYESDASVKAREAIRTRRPQVVHYELTDEVAEDSGLICGGRMDVFIDPLDPSPDLFVVGAGHVGQHVARLAHAVGFRVHVLDDREKFASRDYFPADIEVIVDQIADWLGAAGLKPSAYLVVVTRGHVHDLEALRAVAERPLKYVGMIGSRAKVTRIVDALAEAGVSRDWLDRLHAPIGLQIGAVSPEEIAVSIVAELIATRRNANLAGGAAEPMQGRKNEK